VLIWEVGSPGTADMTRTALILPVTAVFSTIQITIFVRDNRPGR